VNRHYRGKYRYLVGVLGLVLAIAACGQPTAQVKDIDQSDFSFELPVEWVHLQTTDGAGQFYGLADTPLTHAGGDPLAFLAVIEGAQIASFKNLRMAMTGQEYDPLDPELEELPDNGHVISYVEIADAQAWGIRIQMVDDIRVTDFQALAQRDSNDVVVTELSCNQSCFVDQLELFDEIQNSWSLER